MSTTPVRDPKICPVCGNLAEGGCHPCDGPRVDRIIDRASKLAGAEIVSLPGDDPWDAVRAMRHIRQSGREEPPDEDP